MRATVQYRMYYDCHQFSLLEIDVQDLQQIVQSQTSRLAENEQTIRRKEHTIIQNHQVLREKDETIAELR